LDLDSKGKTPVPSTPGRWRQRCPLEDDAASIYGSDAIAGAVNIVTKRKFDGVEVNGCVGEYGKVGRTPRARGPTPANRGRLVASPVAAGYHGNEA
jgi:outer membrane receptor protein involved in Fe transport